jgi:hypothetical protein
MNMRTEQVNPTLERYVAALQDAGPRRYVLAAELALGLARSGHITDVKFRLADRLEAFEAFRSAVEAHASRAAQDDQVSPEADEDTAGRESKRAEACAGHPDGGLGCRRQRPGGQRTGLRLLRRLVRRQPAACDGSPLLLGSLPEPSAAEGATGSPRMPQAARA